MLIICTRLERNLVAEELGKAEFIDLTPHCWNNGSWGRLSDCSKSHKTGTHSSWGSDLGLHGSVSCAPLTGVEAEIGTKEATLKSQGMARGLISGRLSLFFSLNEKFFIDKGKKVPTQQRNLHGTIFLKTLILFWSIANEQCCDSFRWRAKGLSHPYTDIHSPPNSPSIQGSGRLFWSSPSDFFGGRSGSRVYHCSGFSAYRAQARSPQVQELQHLVSTA